MAEIRWGPWSGSSRKSHRLPASTHSAWSLDDDLPTLQKTISSMLTDPALSDVCLVVEGFDVPSHKSVLAAWSRPFRAMFTGAFLESQHQCRVVIEDAEHKHLMVVLDYLYSGRIGLNDQNVMPVSALANRYEVLPLMAQCEGYMKWRLNPSNVCQHLLAAEEHRVPKAAALALDYLAVHFDEVHHDSSGDFYSLGGDTVLHVLQHDGLTVDEETVFQAVDGWAKAWKRRQSIRGATPNFAVGRYPPQSVAEASDILDLDDTTSRDTSSSPKAKDPPSASESLTPLRLGQGEHEAERKGRGSVNSATSRNPSNSGSGRMRGVERGGGGVGSGSDVTDTAVTPNSSRSSRSAISISSGSCANEPLSMPPFPVAATAAKAISAAAAAGAAAAARRCAEERQEAAARQQSASPAAVSTISSTSPRGAHTDERGGGPSSRESTCPASPNLHTEAMPVNAGGGDDGRDGTKYIGELLHGGVGEKPRKGDAGGARQKVLQRRASGPAELRQRRSTKALEGSLGRAASFSHPPPPPDLSVRSARKEIAVEGASRKVSRTDASADARKEEGTSEATVETMASMPEEERAFVDELLMEVRFPLISTSFLCQVVEKSPAISGSRVAQRLLHEAYRFQAIRPDGADVDELFPGNHRVKVGTIEGRFDAHQCGVSVCQSIHGLFELVRSAASDGGQYRGHERVLFGEGDGCIGTVDDYSSSLSEVHLVENVKRRDEKYWLPGQPEEAYFCVRLDRVRRITKFRCQNRYSEEFEVAIRRTRREEWQVIIPRQQSGGHKDVKELDLTRKRVKARHVKVSLRGRKRSCYNTSCYWVELLGF